MIGALVETTRKSSFERGLERMKTSSDGRTVLFGVISSNVGHAWEMPENTNLVKCMPFGTLSSVTYQSDSESAPKVIEYEEMLLPALSVARVLLDSVVNKEICSTVLPALFPLGHSGWYDMYGF